MRSHRTPLICTGLLAAAVALACTLTAIGGASAQERGAVAGAWVFVPFPDGGRPRSDWSQRGHQNWGWSGGDRRLPHAYDWRRWNAPRDHGWRPSDRHAGRWSYRAQPYRPPWSGRYRWPTPPAIREYPYRIPYPYGLSYDRSRQAYWR